MYKLNFLKFKNITIQTAIFSMLFATNVFAIPDVFVDGQVIPTEDIHLVDDRVYMSIAELSKYSDYSAVYDYETNTVNFYNTGTVGATSGTVVKQVNAPKVEEKKEILIFPTNVSNVVNSDTSRSVIKTYELGDFENPQDISTDSFTLDGYFYTLTDITKTENITTDNKEHVETVTVDTATNNVSTILNELEKTKNITTEDGFTGTLQLDIGSIKSEVKGYKNSTYTVAETREYPNLSSPDTSLVPKSITVNGKQYNLADINWESNGDMIDDVTIPSTYKAVAKYTTTATQQTLTGYTTTASYSGILSKVIDGKIIYTAYFDGSPMDAHYGNLEKQLQLDKEINTIMYDEYYIQDIPLDTSNLQEVVYGSSEEIIYETIENEIEDITDEANIIYIEDEKNHTSFILMFAFLIGVIIFFSKKYILNLIKEIKFEKELEEQEIDYLKEKFKKEESDNQYFEELLINHEKRNLIKDE